MHAAKLDLLIEEGSTFRKPFTMKAGRPAAAVDLTGCHVRLEAFAPDGTLDFTLSDDNGGVVLTPLAGRIELVIPVDQIAAFTWDVRRYVLELVWPNGDVKRLARGSLCRSREGK